MKLWAKLGCGLQVALLAKLGIVCGILFKLHVTSVLEINGWNGKDMKTDCLLCCSTLYDVFVNVRDDEGEHVKTMEACANYTIVDQLSELNKPVVRPVKGKDGPKNMDEQQIDAEGSHL